MKEVGSPQLSGYSVCVCVRGGGGWVPGAGQVKPESQTKIPILHPTATHIHICFYMKKKKLSENDPKGRPGWKRRKEIPEGKTQEYVWKVDETY